MRGHEERDARIDNLRLDAAAANDVERAGRDEQDVIGAHHAVLGVDGGAFDDRQDVALHAFAADVGPVAALAPGDLVDLVEEDHAALLDALDRLAGDVLLVDEFLRLFSDEDLPRIDLLALAPIGRSGARTFIRAIADAVYHQERVSLSS